MSARSSCLCSCIMMFCLLASFLQNTTPISSQHSICKCQDCRTQCESLRQARLQEQHCCSISYHIDATTEACQTVQLLSWLK